MASKIFNDRATDRTEFQLHISQYQSYPANKGVLRDFSEARLVDYLNNTCDPERKILISAILDDYRQGKIAIAWRNGEPVYIRMTKLD